MFYLTAPVTKRQLELLQLRKRLERRLCFESHPYGVATQVEDVDTELEAIEHSKGEKEVGVCSPYLLSTPAI